MKQRLYMRSCRPGLHWPVICEYLWRQTGFI